MEKIKEGILIIIYFLLIVLFIRSCDSENAKQKYNNDEAKLKQTKDHKLTHQRNLPQKKLSAEEKWEDATGEKVDAK